MSKGIIDCAVGQSTRIVPWGETGRWAVTTNGLPPELRYWLVKGGWCHVEFGCGDRLTATFPATALQIVAKALGGKMGRAA
jgi:hypothetical protein